jgi:hypothetical protein
MAPGASPKNTVPQLQSVVVDLRQWGYIAPFGRGGVGEGYRSRLVSVSKSGNIVAGFVARDGEGLASRNRPTLVLHVVTVDGEGKLVAESKFPTTMWLGNQIFAVAGGNLLVRTPEELLLSSEHGEVLASKRLADPHIRLELFPNREGVALESLKGVIEVLSTRDLKTLKDCSYPYWVASISNHNSLIRFPERLTDALPFRLQVAELCGTAQFEYSWRYPAGSLILLDDSRFVIHAASTIQLFNRETLRWQHTFGKDEGAGELESDESGTILAVAVGKYVGGSKILDISPRLKSLRIVAFRAADGRQVSEVTVQHPPRYPFDYFAISPDGLLLAILSDGFLQIVPIPAL